MKYWCNEFSTINKEAMKYITLLAICTLSLFKLSVHAQPKRDFVFNPITLNGHALSVAGVALNSRGILAMIEGDPLRALFNVPNWRATCETKPQHQPMSFRVLLRRDGAVVKQWPADEAKPGYSVQLDELWPFAQPGDELIFEPTRAMDELAKRIIQVMPINWLPADGC